MGDAALQAGNSESIVKKHYLNLHTVEDGAAFFGTAPGVEVRRAIITDRKSGETGHLRAI